MPQTENEFNNFSDIIKDKYNRPGYLRQFNEYYVFNHLMKTKMSLCIIVKT